MNLPPSPPQREQPRATQPPRPDSMSDAERLLGIVCGLARELRPNAPDVESRGLNHALEPVFGLVTLARGGLLVRFAGEGERRREADRPAAGGGIFRLF